MKVMIEGKEYWRDAKGNLTPAELVKEIDKARDALVYEWVEKGVSLNKEVVKAISRFIATTENTKSNVLLTTICNLMNVSRLQKC